MSARSLVGLVFKAVYLSMLAMAAWGQSDRGTITSTVLDQGSAVIPGATVTATQSDTGTSSQTVTTGSGNYTLPSLSAGVYDLTVEAVGFSKVSQPQVRVQVAVFQTSQNTYPRSGQLVPRVQF